MEAGDWGKIGEVKGRREGREAEGRRGGKLRREEGGEEEGS